MQSLRIFVSSNVEKLRNHSVTFSVIKMDFTSLEIISFLVKKADMHSKIRTYGSPT